MCPLPLAARFLVLSTRTLDMDSPVYTLTPLHLVGENKKLAQRVIKNQTQAHGLWARSGSSIFKAHEGYSTHVLLVQINPGARGVMHTVL